MVKFRATTYEDGLDGALLLDAHILTTFGNLSGASSLNEIPVQWNMSLCDISLLRPFPSF
jgi:hypothetical protein